MPLDPSLDELVQGGPSPADAASMTHQPEQPNPAAPYLEQARQFGRRTFVEPLRATGFLPQQQTPDWYNQAQGAGGELFRQGPAGMLAEQFPRGGIAETLARNGIVPPGVNENIFSRMIRSRELGTAAQFFTPLLGTLQMARAPASDFFSNFGGKDSFRLVSKETGEELGQFHATYNAGDKNLDIKYMGSFKRTPGGNAFSTHWGIGTHELQTLGPEILKEYPDVQTVSFLRLPGIREGAEKTGRQSRIMKFKVNRTPDGNMTLELMESRRIPQLTAYPRPTPPPLPRNWIQQEHSGVLPISPENPYTSSGMLSRFQPNQNAAPGSLEDIINRLVRESEVN